MDIGAYIRLLGRPGSEPPPPSWATIRDQALAAEGAGFDLVVLEDAALYPDETGDQGVWEAMTMAAGVAAVTTTIGIGHAVINTPYRHPTLIARCAVTLDEIAGGRYRLGIGLGNTPDDYPLFGIEADHRYSRFEEAIAVVHGLLRVGRASLDGRYYRVPDATVVLQGPRPAGIPIVIAAGKPKMLRLAARYADEWNWWVDPDAEGGTTQLRALAREVDEACREVGRDPGSLRRSIDLFSVGAPGAPADAAALAERLLAYEALGFDELRCDIRPAAGQSGAEAMTSMAEVVHLVHQR